MHTNQYLNPYEEGKQQAANIALYEKFFFEQCQRTRASVSPPYESGGQQAADFAAYEQHFLEQGQKAGALLDLKTIYREVSNGR